MDLGPRAASHKGGCGFCTGPRNHGHVRELVETPVHCDVALGPHTPDDYGAFLQTRATFVARDVEADEFRHAVALAEAEIEAAVRNEVDGGGILGHAQRVV